MIETFSGNEMCSSLQIDVAMSKFTQFEYPEDVFSCRGNPAFPEHIPNSRIYIQKKSHNWNSCLVISDEMRTKIYLGNCLKWKTRTNTRKQTKYVLYNGAVAYIASEKTIESNRRYWYVWAYKQTNSFQKHLQCRWKKNDSFDVF